MQKYDFYLIHAKKNYKKREPHHPTSNPTYTTTSQSAISKSVSKSERGWRGQASFAENSSTSYIIVAQTLSFWRYIV